MNGIAIVAAIILSSLVTVLVMRSRLESKTGGTLRPVYDPDGVFLFLDLDVEPTVILKEKYVIF